MPSLTRRTLALAVVTALTVGPSALARRTAPVARGLRVRGAGRLYRGDRRLFATIAPGVPGRDRATVSFVLDRPAVVTVQAVRVGLNSTEKVAWEETRSLAAGPQALEWAPEPTAPVGTHVLRVTVAGDGERRVYGLRRPASVALATAPVVRVLGIEAAFARRSASPHEKMSLTIFADAPSLELRFLRCGHEGVYTDRVDELKGAPVGDSVTLDWTGKRSAPEEIVVQPGAWPSGLYAAQLTAPDGRVGWAPFVLRAPNESVARVAVVLPTHTWQAYNPYDRDGDGWGDTWYAGGNPAVALDRPYRDRGAPPRYRRYDAPFLRWLAERGLEPDVWADDDLDTGATGDDLYARYDLIVFPGHSEYVTEHAYDALVRYRDLGGRLVFLSANNVFWKVTSDGVALRRVKKWRDLGRPEASLLGVQYRANDGGRRQDAFELVGAHEVPWLFAGTGLRNGSRIGDQVGGYGIEIDAVTPDSPPGTVVIAEIRDLFGPGLSAHMTYYETAAGAHVFSAGALDFAGSVLFSPIDRVLENLWNHMLRP